MLYLQRIINLLMVICACAVIGTLVYTEATSQEIVFVATTEDLTDYQVAYQDCLGQNEVFKHLETVMESEMKMCLEDRGH